MRKITLSDVTMKSAGQGGAIALSFREKLELCKLLDRLGVDSVETGAIENRRIDGLLIKSLSTAVERAALTVTVPPTAEGVDYTWSCLREARNPRLQVSLPVSTVQMEYAFHKKPDGMLALIAELVKASRGKGAQVEFCAEDAGRADRDFLLRAIRTAEENGASTVTVCDTAGLLLPETIAGFVREVRAALGEGTRLGVRVSNELYMADACALYAVKAGADEVKVTSAGEDTTSLEKLAVLMRAHGEDLGAESGVSTTQIHRAADQIRRLCRTERSKASPFDAGVREEDDSFSLNVHDDLAAVKKAAEKLGYDLSEEDTAKVYEAFLTAAGKKEAVSARELDLIIASSALQVPPTYVLESYVINAGNVITSTSHLRLLKNGVRQEGIAIGDGPIDASFLAIEQITGTHYELDDFQIRSVTEGREAMGEAMVRLRSDGKLYSGRGISTDIVGSSIMAYVNALNKIVYEESEA